MIVLYNVLSFSNTNPNLSLFSNSTAPLIIKLIPVLSNGSTNPALRPIDTIFFSQKFSM